MDSTGSVSLILTNHPTGGWCHEVEEDRKIIGRADDADIVVPKLFRTVSRRHAEIWTDRRGCWLRDLGSRQGTRVNLIWIDRLAAAKLVAGDLIRLGADLEIQVVAGSPSDERSDDFLFDDEPADSSGGDGTAMPFVPATPRKLLRDTITPAETEVLLWISRGFLDNQELGRRLHRSPNTVRTQVNSILRKLALHNRGEIVGWLKRHQAGPKPPGR
ncbi:MAG: FHA domain-containing protein [Pirellulales bacterium]